MPVSGLLHVAIKTNDLNATIRFYCDMVGLTEAARPDFGYPGAWLAAPEGGAIIHVYAGGPALGAEGRAPQGSAAIDHVSLTARGYHEYVDRFRSGGSRLAGVQGAWYLALAALPLRPERRAA